MASHSEIDNDDVEVIITIESDDSEGGSDTEINLNCAPHNEQQGTNARMDFDLNQAATEILDEAQEQGFDLNVTPTSNTSESSSSRRLSNIERLKILVRLLDKQINGVIKHGAINEAAAKFQFTRKTISKLWNQAKGQRLAMQSYNVDNNRHNGGRKRVQLPR